MLIFQVILHSEVKATLTIYDAWLDLQDGFVNTGQSDGRPTSAYFPLVVSPNSRAGILFSIRLGKTNAEGIGLFVKCRHISKLQIFRVKPKKMHFCCDEFYDITINMQ